MKTLYLECNMGAAGDMLTAALLELLPDPDNFVDRLNGLGIPGVRFEAEKTEKCGITGTHMAVSFQGEEEESVDVPHEHHHEHNHDHEHEHEHEHEHDHEHEHHHDHEHEHHHDHEHEHEHEHDHEHDHDHGHDHNGHHHVHHGLGDIEHVVSHLDLPQDVRDDVTAVYRLIAEAEGHVHGKPMDEIHFHEVGTMDAVADVTAVCLLMHELAPDRVVASPIHVGSGQVKCAHGILPVPAPATAYLLNGIPTYGGDVEGELCTPTGAALIRYFVESFGSQPQMRVEKIGYGCGKKEFERANCVRASIGETGQDRDSVIELCCNLDDMTAEAIGYAMEALLDAGALDVYTTTIGMKKNRPGIQLSCMCRVSQREEMIRLIFLHTTTLGIRESEFNRYVLQRSTETVETKYGPVRIKKAEGWGVSREKPEYDDLTKIAREQDISISEVRKLLSEDGRQSS